MQYLTALLPLAALAAANPLERRGGDACLAAVTGKAALGDDKIRGSHCASFLATTVTPEAVTVTTTVTGDESSTWGDWKRSEVTYCPNEVPNYASACDDAGYKSACSKFGFTKEYTTTIEATTTTKTVYTKPTSCDAKATATVTVTKEGGKGGSATVTVTETVTSGGLSGGPTGYPGGKCLSDSDAKKIVDNFVILLEYTNYNGTQGPPGRGYQQNVSDATLDPSFQDISDSINFMAGKPLGSVTFKDKADFDAGQGSQSELSVSVLNIWHGCKDITFRYLIASPTGPAGFPVQGLNYMIVNDKGLVTKQYAEFDNGAFLQSYGKDCAIVPPTVAPTTAARRSLF